MTSYKLKVNPALRGEITLPSLNYPLKSGDTVTLDESQFNKSEIQMAIKKQYLIKESSQEVRSPKKIEHDESNYIDEQDESSDEDLDINPLDYAVKGKTTVWDPETNSGLSAEDGKKKALGQINSVEMETQVGQVNFTKKGESETVETTDKPKGKISPKDKVKSKNRPSAKKKPQVLPMPDDAAVDLVTGSSEDTIAFVDQEQEIERVSKHPVLKRKLQEMADELLQESGDEEHTAKKKAPVKKRATAKRKATTKKRTAKQNEEIE